MSDPDSTRRRVDELLRQQRSSSRGVVDALESVCVLAAEDLELVGATVSLMPTVRAHTVAASSSPHARRIEEAQFSVGEGPTREAFVQRRPVLTPIIDDTAARRWPGWLAAAREGGVVAVYAFPLHVGASIFGVLTLYVGESWPLDPSAVLTATVYAEVATELLLDSSLPDGHERLAPDLTAQLDTHADVYQAQGMVMVHHGVSLPVALALMRAHAWSRGLELVTLASDIVTGRAMPPRDAP